ncbi:taspase, threonine aspartase, 1, partial [Kappamyces sp. JEL0680]
MIAVHAGAGFHSPENTRKYKELLKSVCERGKLLLQRGECAEKIALFCIACLEQSPLTNAGIEGSNMTLVGSIENDACVMDSDG